MAGQWTQLIRKSCTYMSFYCSQAPSPKRIGYRARDVTYVLPRLAEDPSAGASRPRLSALFLFRTRKAGCSLLDQLIHGLVSDSLDGSYEGEVPVLPHVLIHIVPRPSLSGA